MRNRRAGIHEEGGREAGFTLIEALVALMIAATALVVLMGRLGGSADIQQTLAMHDLAMQGALNKLTELSIEDSNSSLNERQGVLEIGEMQLAWRSWSEKTMLDGFMRLNVSVTPSNEPAVTVFLYRVVQ